MNQDYCGIYQNCISDSKTKNNRNSWRQALGVTSRTYELRKARTKRPTGIKFRREWSNRAISRNQLFLLFYINKHLNLINDANKLNPNWYSYPAVSRLISLEMNKWHVANLFNHYLSEWDYFQNFEFINSINFWSILCVVGFLLLYSLDCKQ